MSGQSHRPIFVLGCPRSGTTLLQQMLHSHRRIAMPAETRFVQRAYEDRLDFGDLESAGHRRALGEWITNGKGTRFPRLELDAGPVVEEIVNGPPTVGSALAIVFRAYARSQGKARWGDKRPNYFRIVPVLRRMFPDAQFVHLVRDGRDAVGSLKGMPWFTDDVLTAALTWREAVDCGRRLAARLGPRTFHELRYEDLVTDPERELRALCSFLGEEYDPAMAEPHVLARKTVPTKRTWHRRTKDAVNTANLGAWTDRLEPREASLVDHVLASRLVRYGYEPAGLPRPPASDLSRFHRAATHRWRTVRGSALKDRMTRLREPNPVASQLSGSALTEG